MTDLPALYKLAEDENILVLFFPLPATTSCCAQDGPCSRSVGLDPSLTGSTEEVRRLAHELGHCVTGSLYGKYTAPELRARYERRADAWAMEKLIPFNELLAALRAGITEAWDLAEHFNVPDDFMRKVLAHYERRITVTNG